MSEVRCPKCNTPMIINSDFYRCKECDIRYPKLTLSEI